MKHTNTPNTEAIVELTDDELNVVSGGVNGGYPTGEEVLLAAPDVVIHAHTTHRHKAKIYGNKSPIIRSPTFSAE